MDGSLSTVLTLIQLECRTRTQSNDTPYHNTILFACSYFDPVYGCYCSKSKAAWVLDERIQMNHCRSCALHVG